MSEIKPLADFGDPVFPQETHNADGSTSVWCGINLRDYLAAAAMRECIVRGLDLNNADTIAHIAYRQADAMLAARERKEQ